MSQGALAPTTNHRARPYIVSVAGYDLRAARKVFIRMARAERRAAAQGQRELVGFLKTHPTETRRIAHWSATSRLIEAGQQRPESIERLMNPLIWDH